MLIEHRKGDLFEIANEPDFSEFALAHCISEDCVMGKGIATEFKRRFGDVSELRKQVAQGKKTGSACILIKERPIYYLITKNIYYLTPTYDSLRKSLQDMHASIIRLGVPGILMPKIGCGLDRLEWSTVQPMLEDVFKKTDIKIIVCSL